MCSGVLWLRQRDGVHLRELSVFSEGAAAMSWPTYWLVSECTHKPFFLALEALEMQQLLLPTPEMQQPLLLPTPTPRTPLLRCNKSTRRAW